MASSLVLFPLSSLIARFFARSFRPFFSVFFFLFVFVAVELLRPTAPAGRRPVEAPPLQPLGILRL